MDFFTSLFKNRRKANQSVFVEDSSSIYKIEGDIVEDDVPDLIRISYEKRIEELKKCPKNFNDMLPANNGKYVLNSDEITFLHEFYSQLEMNNIKPNIFIRRMSGGDLVMDYKGCPFGRVFLQGSGEYWIQYYIGINGRNKVINGNLRDLIPYIYKWIRYIKNYL